jgi:hypothetical protein
LAAVEVVLAEATSRNLLMQRSSDFWSITELGHRFLNDLQSLFLMRGE